MSATIAGPDGKSRCRWSGAAPEFLAYHDTEWGFPVDDDRRLFEKLSLEGFQSGLSWRTILAKRENFRAAFHDFDFALVKDTPFGHRANGELGTLEFRAEFFNIFNLVNFGLPSNIVRGSGFGIISKTAGSSRQIQFSLKVVF